MKKKVRGPVPLTLKSDLGSFNGVERNKTKKRREEEKRKLPREGGWILGFLSVRR